MTEFETSTKYSVSHIGHTGACTFKDGSPSRLHAPAVRSHPEATKQDWNWVRQRYCWIGGQPRGLKSLRRAT